MKIFHFDNLLRSPLFLGVVSVVLSLFTLIIFILIFSSKFFPEYLRFRFENSIDTFEIQGKDFTPIIFGNGGYKNNSAIVTEVLAGEAVLSTKTNFSANRYAFAEWNARGIHPKLKIYLFWRLEEDLSKLYSAELHFLKDGNHIFDLAKNPHWRGQIVELSVGIFGNLRNQPFIFESISLRPLSLFLAMKVIPAQWTSSNFWKPNSINYSVGTISGKHFSPGLFFGLLFLLSLVLVEIFSHFFCSFDNAVSETPRTKAYLTVILLCCIGLDLPRMLGRFEQATETHHVFAGKTLAERASVASLRCNMMEKYMRIGWHTVPDPKRPGHTILAPHNFSCSDDAPLPNF